MIVRTLTKVIKNKLNKGKAILLIGPRQVGKTTLIQNLLKEREHLFLNGDDPTVKKLLDSPNTQELRAIIGKQRFIFIDEAQRFENIGITLKLITDQFKDVQLLVTGSSAFELKNLINEPLTGRKWQYHLYPISWQEFENHFTYITAQQQLEHRLMFGMYPEVVMHLGEEKERLKVLTESYLYKDVYSFFNIKKPLVLEKLLSALAYQLGQEVSFNELAKILGIDKNTVSAYIDILENNYIVFRLPAFSKNLRSEIKRNQKIYFYDNGLRNAVIGDYRPMEVRQDKGALWENFLISERFKLNNYQQRDCKSFFWRTTRQQEIDYIEVENQKISAFEFKWKSKKKVKIPKTFTDTYNTEVQIIDQDSFKAFLTV